MERWKDTAQLKKRLGGHSRRVLAVLSSCLLLFSQPLFSQNFTFDHLTIDQELSNNTIYAIAEDKDGFMWFGTRDGLNKYDGYDFTVFKAGAGDQPSLPGNNVQSLFLHPNGDLWVGLLAGGLCVLDRATQQFRVNPFAGQVFEDWGAVSVEAIFMDSKGYIWLGTSGQGVVRIDPDGKHLAHFGLGHPEPGRRLSNDACFSFVEDERSNIWMGTAGSQIHCYLRQKDLIEVVEGDPTAGFDLSSYNKSLLYKNGVLWIGTEGNGLIQYDPGTKKFIRKALGNTLIKDVALYGETVLISTDGSGLYFTEDDGESFRSVRFTPNLINSLNTNALYDIFIDKSRNIWIGSFNGGVNVHFPNKTEFLTYGQGPSHADAPGSESVLAFFEDREGFIWIGKDGGGLLRFNPADHTYAAYRADPDNPGSISSDVVTSIFEDSKGRLWVGTFTYGLNLFDRKSGRFKTFLNDPRDSHSISNNNVWSIQEDRAGHLWIGTLGGGLNRLDFEKQQFYRYQPDTRIPPRPGMLSSWNVRVLLVDKEDNLWVGTELGGLHRWDPLKGRFEHWQIDARDALSMQSNFILCLHQDKKGRLWIGTEGGGLHRMLEDGKTFKHYTVKEGLPSNVIAAIEEDDNGILWLSTNMGLASLNPGTGVITNFDRHDGLQSNQFNPGASLRARNGEIYFGGVMGVNAFLPEKVQVSPLPARLVFTDFKLFNKSFPIGKRQGRAFISGPLNERPLIQLHYYDNVFTIEFAALDFINPSKYQYAYRLEGFEETWNQVDSRHRLATYTNLDAGEYTFQVKAAINPGLWNEEPIELVIRISPPFWKTWWFILLAVLAVVGSVALFVHYFDAKRREGHQQELMRVEQEVLKLRNERLSEEVLEKNARLSAALLQSAHKNNSLDRMKKQLMELTQEQNADAEQKKEIRQLVRKIDQELSSEDYWVQFQLNFDQVHQDFSRLLHLRHPQLSSNDIQLCCLLRIHMSNREIASVQNISLSAVEKSKYRLKRKLDLGKEADLNRYILDIS